MIQKQHCKKCDRELTRDEIALFRKLVNRGATEYCCITCLSEHFHVNEEALRKKIDYFKETGCTLFLM